MRFAINARVAITFYGTFDNSLWNIAVSYSVLCSSYCLIFAFGIIITFANRKNSSGESIVSCAVCSRCLGIHRSVVWRHPNTPSVCQAPSDSQLKSSCMITTSSSVFVCQLRINFLPVPENGVLFSRNVWFLLLCYSFVYYSINLIQAAC